MATKNYTDIDQLPISLNITVRELKVIDRLMTEHGAEWNGWASERQLHKDIRQILAPSRSVQIDAARQQVRCREVQQRSRVHNQEGGIY